MSNVPFVGLRPFKREESNIFFGRQGRVADLLAAFADSHLITVVAPAGSGKTSLINAGLIPRLLEGDLTHPGGHWQIAEMRPGQQPFHNLATALRAEQALDADIHTIPLDAPALQGNPNVLHELLAKHHFPQQNKLLVICDQFEEVFQDRHDEAAAFIDMLVASTKAHTLASGAVSNNIYVLLNLRSGYLKQCSAFPALAVAMNKGLYQLPALSPEQLMAAIEKPIGMFGGSIGHELKTQLLEDAAQNHLPLLQLVMLKLWQKSPDKDLTIFDYYVIGGIRSILSNHADQLFQSLTVEQQALSKIIFKTIFFSDQQGGYYTQPTKLSDVAALAGVDRKAIIAIADLFRQEGVGMVLPALPQVLSAETLLNVAHDSYCLQWHRLTDWLEEEAKAASNYVLLRKAAQHHQRKHSALLRSSELERLWQWYDEAKPTENWSKRYGGEFRLTEAFLKKCKKIALIKKVSIVMVSVLLLIVTSIFSFAFLSGDLQGTSIEYQQSGKQAGKHVTAQAE